MKLHRPSPALVVSIVALVVASGGTAIATTKVLIHSSSQIRDGAIRGRDLRRGTITAKQIKRGSLTSKLFRDGSITGSSTDAPGAASTSRALELHRQAGPELPDGGTAEVARLDLPPGTYAIFAKVNLAPKTDQTLLSGLTDTQHTKPASCRIDVGGAGDYAEGALVEPQSASVLNLSLQLTRTLGAATPAVLTCGATGVDWRAADTSIIAVEVGSGARTEAP